MPDRKGVLCIPFPNAYRETAEDDVLRRTTQWTIAAAADAHVELSTVAGDYDSYQQVVDRLYELIRDADLVVVLIQEGNPNVYFEAGYAMGLAKPVLFVARESEVAAFDVQGIERLTYRELDEEDRGRLTNAIRISLDKSASSIAIGRGLGLVRGHLLSLSPQTPLLEWCMAHALDSLLTWIRSWSDSTLEVYGAEGVLDMGVFIMSKLDDSGFATAYYTGHSSWRYADYGSEVPAQDYFEATREAVNRGPTIARTYVVDDTEQLDEQAFRERAWADASGGLQISYALLRDLPNARARDFGLWDESLVGEVEYVSDPDGWPRLHRCRYSADRLHLKEARNWRRAIERVARPCPDLPSESLLLNQSVTAVSHWCDDDSLPGKADCSPYHSGWQRLRLCDVVSTPRWHAGFYSQAFQQWSESVRNHDPTQKLHLLITGLADYGMLYWMAQSIPHRVRSRCVFHVLDICRTPLKSCQWLQERLTECSPPLVLDLRLHHRDVFNNCIDSESIDLIASDAFLTRFVNEEEKRCVLAQWLRMLRPTGQVVTTARLRERRADIEDYDRREFVQRTLRRAQSNSEKGLADVAASYAWYIQSYPFVDDDEMRRFLESNVARPYKVHVAYEKLEQMEMVSGRYAHITITGRKE